MDQQSFDFSPQLIRTLQTARHITVLTGAGISAESGVPTFRDAQTGLWARYRPEDLATPQAFRRDPRLVWEWYTWRRGLIGEVKPNPAHLALAAMERVTAKFTLVTQNVDGLHRQAGSSNILELHGNICRTRCFSEDILIEEWDETEAVPPRCPNCGGLLRPDVVWFGENLPAEALQEALLATQDCDLFFSIGTSTLVEPAASLPFLALRQGAVVVEVNPERTPLTRTATYSFQAPAGQLLPALVAIAWPQGISG